MDNDLDLIKKALAILKITRFIKKSFLNLHSMQNNTQYFIRYFTSSSK